MDGLLPELDQLYGFRKPSPYACTKTPYTKVEAQTALNARMRSRHGRPERLRIYHCQRCNAWHLTSKEYNPYTS